MKCLLIAIALCVVSGYAVYDYFNHPDLTETQMTWMLCGYEMRNMELKYEKEYSDEVLYYVCNGLLEYYPAFIEDELFENQA